MIGKFVDVNQNNLEITFKTRLHSSRMRTARALTVSPSMLCAGGGVSAPGGCLLPGGVCSQGVSARRVCVSAPGGCLLPGGCVSQHALRQTPSPPVNRILDTRL